MLWYLMHYHINSDLSQNKWSCSLCHLITYINILMMDNLLVDCFRIVIMSKWNYVTRQTYIDQFKDNNRRRGDYGHLKTNKNRCNMALKRLIKNMSCESTSNCRPCSLLLINQSFLSSSSFSFFPWSNNVNHISLDLCYCNVFKLNLILYQIWVVLAGCSKSKRN